MNGKIRNQKTSDGITEFDIKSLVYIMETETKLFCYMYMCLFKNDTKMIFRA